MNNSSDSENNNDYNKIKIDSQKKRGRPKKNLFLDKSTKSSEKKEITNDEKDIILHLPVFMPKNNKKHVETKNNSDYESESDNKNDDTMLSVSDSDESDISETDESISQYKKLYKKELEENKKKDLIIKNLRENKNNSNIFDSDIQKDLSTHVINLNLIDNNTNKPIEQKKNDIHCWWCTYSFENTPCFIPEKYYLDKYYVFGCFCSFNCAASYNLNLNDYKIMERYALLKKLYNVNNNDNYKLSPPKEILKKYGGIISIEDYRKNFITCDKEFRLNLPPLVALHHIIEEITIEKNENKDNKINLSGIKKKLPMVKNNLFNTMGIKNK